MMTHTKTPPLKMLAAIGATLLLWGLVLAYASSPAWAADITVDTTADNVTDDDLCSLREAITSANNDPTAAPAAGECANGSGTDTINFAIAGDGPHTIKLVSTLPNITRGSVLTIDGQQNRITLSGDNKYRVLAVDFGARLDLNNLTVANGNSGDNDGGGISNNGGTLNVSNSTFAGNSADRGGGIYIVDAEPTLSNTIVANNTGGNCAAPGTTITDGGYNLDDADPADDASGSCYFDKPTSQTNTPAGLDPEGLKDNGGPTQTIALQAGSAAIDKGADVNCPDTDQRGVSRPQGSGCDIGAFELKIPVTVNSTADTDDGACTGDANGCTLREAINAANASPGADTTTFDLGAGPHTIALSSTLPSITDGDGLTIDGGQNQITVSGGGIVRVLVVSSGAKLDLKNLTVANGDSGGGSGGGIYNQGTLSITNSTIRDNSAYYSYRYGGGIYNEGTLSVTSSTISGNEADSGSGIYNRGTLSITNSTISGNKSSLNGGGIYNNGGTAALGNTIVANSIRGGSCDGSIIDGGYNLSSDASCGFREATSLSEKDPRLGGLADNGGPTKTHALLSGSPAIDQGKASGTTTDQRGETRPQTTNRRAEALMWG